MNCVIFFVTTNNVMFCAMIIVFWYFYRFHHWHLLAFLHNSCIGIDSCVYGNITLYKEEG